MIRRFLAARALPVLLLSLLGLNSCAKDYVTGKTTFSLISESQEVEMGKEYDPQVIAEYGLYDNPKLAAYVDSLGQAIARVSQRPNLKYTYRVIDSPVVNAFAIPGGYIYITRGILAHFNSEDELAGVIGHETGHVVARHSAEQMSREQLASLGLGLGSMLSERFAKFANLAGSGLSLMFLSFSRSQESEADLLGVEYSTEVGFDAHKMAHFFNTIKRISDEGGQRLPTFLSTHPDPGDREIRVNGLATEWQKKVPYKPLDRSRTGFLRRIDGIVYGNDPRQGFTENGVFYHPALRFEFPVPSGWKLNNSPTVVQMANADGNAVIQFNLGSTDSPATEADNFITKSGATVTSRQAVSVRTFNAVAVESNVQSDQQAIRVLSYFIKKDDKVYVFHGFTTPELYQANVGTFASVMKGFDELKDRAMLEKKPSRLKIEPASQSGDLAAVLKAMGMKEAMVGELAILNGMQTTDRVAKGDLLKLVRE